MKYVKIEGGVKLASFISPMSATLSHAPPFDDPKWLFESKWDGYRAVAELNGKDTRFTRVMECHTAKHIRKFITSW
jgi:ATP-dependent DNA ligase